MKTKVWGIYGSSPDKKAILWELTNHQRKGQMTRYIVAKSLLVGLSDQKKASIKMKKEGDIYLGIFGKDEVKMTDTHLPWFYNPLIFVFLCIFSFF